MADKLLTVVITMPDNAPGDEAERIRLMLGSGMIDRVHIRKPDWMICGKNYAIQITQRLHI